MCCSTAFLSMQLPKILFQPTPKPRSRLRHDHIAFTDSRSINEVALLEAPDDMPHSGDGSLKTASDLVCVLLPLRRVEELEADK
jgi:hypothetical protein